MNEMRRRLEPFGPRLIKVEPPEQGNPKSGKKAVEVGFQLSPHSWGDTDIEAWIEAGGNYGILLGEGLIGIDADSLDLFELFPITLTIKSGSGRGGHLFYRSDIGDNGTIHDAEGKNVGNIQSKFKYLVGPGSHHWSGSVYEVLHDDPIAWLNKVELEKILSRSKFDIHWSGAAREKADDAADEEGKLVGVDIPIQDLVNINELKQIGHAEFQGEHPIHGSTTGQNFCVNTDKNAWFCFRCNSGGGPLSWLAVKEGLIQCHEAQRGALRGELFLKTLSIARGLGYPIEDMGVPMDIPPEALKYFDKNVKFIPKRLADEILGELHVVTLGSNVFIYDPDEGIYKDLGEAPIYRLIYSKLGEAYRDYHAREAVKIVKFETEIDEARELKPELIAVENGILNVLTRELRPFSPDEFTTVKLPVKYDPKASMATIKGFVETCVHPEDRETLQEFSGYCLWKTHIYRKGVVLHGPPQSGKTTFTEALRDMLGGTKNVASTQLHDIISDRFAAAALYGKLGNFAPELDNREVVYTGKIKALTGGDTFTAQFKGRDSFQFVSYAKQLYNCNKLPTVSPSENAAFFTRFELVRFPNQFLGKNADPDIHRKLRTPEAFSGMLNWCLEGLGRLVTRGGFKVRMDVEDVKERYIVTSDPADYFIKTQVEQEYGYALPKDQAREAIKRMCKRFGAFDPSDRATGIAMKGAEIKDIRVMHEGNRIETWAGIKLVDDKIYEGLYSLVKDGTNYVKCYVKENGEDILGKGLMLGQQLRTRKPCFIWRTKGRGSKGAGG
jgi:putative DNA primase/helicase